MKNLCPGGQVMDKTTKECRPPLKRGRRSGSSTKANSSTKAKKPCPGGQVMDKTTKECRPPLKRGRTAKRASKSPSKSPKNATLDKYGFAIPVFKPKTYKDEKTYKQTSMLAFSKKRS